MSSNGLLSAAEKLSNRIHEIHNQPGYMQIWIEAKKTLGPYRGLNYADELAELREQIRLCKEANELFQ